MRTWKLKDSGIQADFPLVFDIEAGTYAQKPEPADVENIWSQLKQGLITVADQVCGLTKEIPRRAETWWWNEKVKLAISEKKRLWKAWKTGGSKDEYINANKCAKHAVYIARKEAVDFFYKNILPGKDVPNK